MVVVLLKYLKRGKFVAFPCLQHVMSAIIGKYHIILQHKWFKDSHILNYSNLKVHKVRINFENYKESMNKYFSSTPLL